MVSELAGEGAMPPQLPTLARRLLKIAELRDRFQQQIRSGSKLCRGVIKRKVFRYFNPSVGAFQSVIHHRRFRFFPSIASSSFWNRSARCSSKVLVNRTSWSKSVKRSSVVLVNSLSVCIGRSPAIPIQFLSKVLITSLWSRSAKISSAELVVVVSSSQRRTRKEKVNPLFLAFNCSSRNRSVECTSTTFVVDSVCVGRLPTILTQNSAMDSRSRSVDFVCVSRSSRGEQPVLDSDFACVDYVSGIDESIAGLMDDVQSFVPGFDFIERFLSQSLKISDNSSDEIEDGVESLDEGDNEMLKAVNKVRRRRFVVAYEDKDDVSESCAAWGSDFKLVLKPYQKKSDMEFDIPDFGKMSPEAQQDIWSSQTRLASIKKELREVKRKNEEKNDLKFSYVSHKTVTEYKEAKALGVGAVPILVGPVLYLLLSKLSKGVEKSFPFLSLLDKILPIYKEVVSELIEMHMLSAAFHFDALEVDFDPGIEGFVVGVKDLAVDLDLGVEDLGGTLDLIEGSVAQEVGVADLVGEDCPVFYGLYCFCQTYARGSGFCYVNDIMFAILELLKVHEQ